MCHPAILFWLRWRHLNTNFPLSPHELPTFTDNFPPSFVPPPHLVVFLNYPLKITSDLQLPKQISLFKCLPSFCRILYYWLLSFLKFSPPLTFVLPSSLGNLPWLLYSFSHFISIFPTALNVLYFAFSWDCMLSSFISPASGFPWMMSYSRVAPTLTYDVRPHESPAQTFLHLLYNCLEGSSTSTSHCCLKFSSTEPLPLSLPKLDLNLAICHETVLSS